jgi:type IV pilus assembly protein PilX
MNGHGSSASRQRGVALVTSLLLLVIITILAVSMFRSFGTKEKIAGNLSEKERALHAAASAQQYAEWWLLQGGNTAIGAIACAPGPPVPATPTSGQICNQTLLQYYGLTQMAQVTFPWPIRVTYTPQNMLLASLGQTSPNNNTNPVYFDTPAFHITDLGTAADAAGEAYLIDAYGYGSAASTVAIVESTYEVQQGVVNRGGL